MNGTSYDASNAKTHIQWNHIDGPALVLKNGSIQWLSFWDRFLLLFGLTSVKKLERKYWRRQWV